jgi:serine/threonine protein kinase
MRLTSSSSSATPIVTRSAPPSPLELSAMMPLWRYSVQAQVGMGGMGTVFRGTQLSLGRPVAIKVLRVSDGYDYAFEDRFRREAGHGPLSHPNIVAIYDYGHLGSEFLYFVMEFVDGMDMGEIMAPGPHDARAGAATLPQICAGLEYAHSKGIVHRDIKPANIMLTRQGEVKITDFRSRQERHALAFDGHGDAHGHGHARVCRAGAVHMPIAKWITGPTSTPSAC